MPTLDRDLPVAADVITAVVQHEFFKFQVQKQAETQVEAYLSTRVKVLGAVLTAALAVLGTFGFHQYSSFTDVVRDVQAKSAALDAKTREAERLIAEAKAAVNNATPLLEL